MYRIAKVSIQAIYRDTIQSPNGGGGGLKVRNELTSVSSASNCCIFWSFASSSSFTAAAFSAAIFAFFRISHFSSSDSSFSDANYKEDRKISFKITVLLGIVYNCQYLNERTKHTLSQTPPASLKKYTYQHFSNV